MNTDFLIIGQGLAGSLLAWRLLQQKKSVMLVDQHHKDSSTRVAAGLINPLAGKRLSRIDFIDDWLSSAEKTYQELESEFKQTLFHRRNMLRVFDSSEQRQYLQRRIKEGKSTAFLGEEIHPGNISGKINTPFGGVCQKRTGFVDLPLLLDRFKEYFDRSGSMRDEHVVYSDLKFDQEKIIWKDVCAKQIIFCEGYKGIENPWFNWLPFTLAKGEILTLKLRKMPLTNAQEIINAKHWLVPMKSNIVRFGSTYVHDQIDARITHSGRAELLAGLEHMLIDNQVVEIISQQAGVRPATQDRLPFLGRHPHLQNVYIFNGFGARGALSIPWCAEVMSGYLNGQQPLPSTLDILRYSHLCPI